VGHALPAADLATHADLVHRNGVYAALWRKQTSGDDAASVAPVFQAAPRVAE